MGSLPLGRRERARLIWGFFLVVAGGTVRCGEEVHVALSSLQSRCARARFDLTRLGA